MRGGPSGSPRYLGRPVYPKRLLGALCASLVLAACGGPDPAPAGMTQGEAEALDDAAEMLEQRRLPPEAISGTPSSEAEQGTGPAR